MATVHVREVECKSVLNRVHSDKMPFKWSINPYRGCQHACIYCYARRYHEYLDLGPDRDFETQIFAKVNAPEVLRTELARPTWKREWVAIGTAVDAYQPIEGRYKITRRVLEALCDYDTPVSIVTKNTMILRDADVLQRLSNRAGCRVYFSVTTMDDRLAKKLEPETPPPLRRLQAMQHLVRLGVDAGVLVAPVLPGITDDDASLRRVALAAAAHGARWLSGAPLRLQGSVRNVYLSFLEEAFPRLTRLYDAMYRGEYAPRRYRDRVAAKIHEMSKILDMDRRFGYVKSPTPSVSERPESGPERRRFEPAESAFAERPTARRPIAVAIGRGAAQLRLFG